MILMSTTVDVTKFSLATLPEKMLDWAFEVMMAQAELMKDLWQIYINVDTGSARDSIRVERGGEEKDWRSIRVRGGGYVINPRTGRLVDYMPVLEAKYGAGKMAFEEIKPTLLMMLKEGTVERWATK
jgi:hypothetical protein